MQVLDPEAAQARRAGGLAEPLRGPGGIEERPGQRGAHRAGDEGGGRLAALGEEQLRGGQPLALLGERRGLEPAGELAELEVAGAHLERGETDAPRQRGEGDAADRVGRIEEGVLEDHAGAEHPGHLAAHQAAAVRLLDLIPEHRGLRTGRNYVEKEEPLRGKPHGPIG